MTYRGTKFSTIHVEATTLSDAWFQLLYHAYHSGRRYLITRGSYEGSYRAEFDFASGFIKYPHDRPLAPIMPEGLNISPPTSDEKIWEYFETYLMDPQLGKNEEYKYAVWINGDVQGCDREVAKRLQRLEELIKACEGPHKVAAAVKYCEILRNAISRDVLEPAITPIEWVIKHFKEAGYGTNHCFIQVGYPDSFVSYERPYTNELERGTSPCLRGIDFKIVDNILITTVYFRSWDLVGGFPENLGGITLLSEFVAASLGDVEAGPLAFCSKGLHVYDFYLEPLKCLLRAD